MLLMNVTKQSLIRLAVILALAPLMVLSMNCGGPGAAVTALGVAAPAGRAAKPGDARISFVNIDKEGRCGPGPRVQSRILIDPAGGAKLVTEDCQAIAPRALPVEEIGLLAHNLKNAIYGGRAFDRVDADAGGAAAPRASSEYLCRGRDERGEPGQTRVADLVLRQTDVHGPAESAALILALYDRDGKYVKTLQTAELKLRRIPAAEKDRVQYVSEDQRLSVWIDQQGGRRTAKLHLDDRREVQNLNCVTH